MRKAGLLRTVVYVDELEEDVTENDEPTINVDVYHSVSYNKKISTKPKHIKYVKDVKRKLVTIKYQK